MGLCSPDMPSPAPPISPAAVGRHYDLLDRFYRDIWGESMHHGLWRNGCESLANAQQSLLQTALEHLALEAGHEVCDVGCGYGQAARLMAETRRVRVTGVTNSAAQFQHAQLAAAPALPVTFLLEDWQKTTLPDTCFDRVLAVESIEHMEDKALALRQMARVMKPGGRLVLCVWMHGPPPTQRERRWLVDAVCRNGRIPSFTEEACIPCWLAGAGFQAVARHDLSREAAPTWLRLGVQFLQTMVRRPSLVRLLWPVRQEAAAFGLSALRLWLGYRFGTFRYAIYTAEKPPH